MNLRLVFGRKKLLNEGLTLVTPGGVLLEILAVHYIKIITRGLVLFY